MKKNILKKISIGLLSAAMMVSMTACNTKIKVNYDYNAEDYVTLGEYKGIEVSVDTDAIENNLINTRIQNDLESNTTYVETTRAAQADDKVTIDFKGSIGGEQVSGFSDNDYSIVLGKDTFTVEGFVDELYGVKSGDVKVVTLTVPEDFSDAPEYAGRKIVFEITVKTVAQPNVPMITDTYACMDKDITINPGCTEFIHTGIALEIPTGLVGLIYARSGMACKRGLAPANKVGVIDSDYRGEIMVALYNHSDEAVTVSKGERIAQLVLAPFITADFTEADSLEDSVRGEGGFGSTGTH